MLTIRDVKQNRKENQDSGMPTGYADWGRILRHIPCGLNQDKPIYIRGLGGVSLACPSPRKPSNQFLFCLFVRAVRAGEVKLCGRVTDAVSDAEAGSWKLSSCSTAVARAQMLLCVWVLSRFGLYVNLFGFVSMPSAWVLQDSCKLYL